LTCIVVDASVTLSWCFPDEQTVGSMSVLDRLKTGERALVPAFWAAGLGLWGAHACKPLSIGRHANRDLHKKKKQKN